METIEIKDFKELAHGENTHQYAAISKVEGGIDYEIVGREKNLTYIDYLNLSQAVKICAEFFDVACTVIVNEALVCSVALGSNIETSYVKALDCDPLSIPGGTAGFTQEVTYEVAKQLKQVNIRNIIAPKFSKEAYSYLLDTDMNMIAVKTPLHEIQGFSAKDIKVTPFGILIEEQNNSKLTKDTFNVVSQIKPTQEQAEDGIFAWKIAKHLQSKSVVVAKDLSTKAIIQAKTNGVSATELGMDYSCECSKDAVLVTDGVIENVQIINTAIQGRIALIIEAGDGINSKQIIKLADKYGLSLIHTKIRNNKY